MEQLYVSSQDHLIRAGEVRELLARERSASTRAAWLVSRHVAAGTWAIPAFAGPVSSDSGTLEDEPSASRRTRHDGEDGNLPSKLDTTELGSIDLGRPLREIERDIAERTIRRFDGNQSAAARALGISRTTIWRMLQREG
jgi:DNA-binding NtrC family response regulator